MCVLSQGDYRLYSSFQSPDIQNPDIEFPCNRDIKIRISKQEICLNIQIFMLWYPDFCPVIEAMLQNPDKKSRYQLKQIRIVKQCFEIRTKNLDIDASGRWITIFLAAKSGYPETGVLVSSFNLNFDFIATHFQGFLLQCSSLMVKGYWVLIKKSQVWFPSSNIRRMSWFCIMNRLRRMMAGPLTVNWRAKYLN